MAAVWVAAEVHVLWTPRSATMPALQSRVGNIMESSPHPPAAFFLEGAGFAIIDAMSNRILALAIARLTATRGAPKISPGQTTHGS
ncbi:MAG: hypothetical protein WAO35_15995 [Terriglobia bacterium]